MDYSILEIQQVNCYNICWNSKGGNLLYHLYQKFKIINNGRDSKQCYINIVLDGPAMESAYKNTLIKLLIFNVIINYQNK